MDYKVLRSDYDALRQNSIWVAVLEHLRERETFYATQLATGAINEPMSQGKLWQEMIREVKKLRDYPERILTPQE